METASLNRTFIVLLMLAQMQCCAAAEPAYDLSPIARKYALSVLSLIQQHSISNNKIDFKRLKNQTLELARGARTTQDTYPAIRYAVGELPDHHSCHIAPVSQPECSNHDGEQKQKMRLPVPAGQESPSGRMLIESVHKVAYIKVPGIIAYDLAPLEDYAVTLRRNLVSLNKEKPEGWVVDLRQNAGGNNWPMMAGLGPLLGARVIVFFF